MDQQGDQVSVVVVYVTPGGEEEGVDEGEQQRRRKSGTIVSVFASCLLDEDHKLS